MQKEPVEKESIDRFSLSIVISMSQFLEHGTESPIFSARFAESLQKLDKKCHNTVGRYQFFYFQSNLARVHSGQCQSDDRMIVFCGYGAIFPFVIEM
jgi:hypothetical protein